MVENDSFIFCLDGDLMKTTFEDMRRKDEFVDLTVILPNRSLSCHQLILAAAIPYLRTKLQRFEQGITPQERERKITLQEINLPETDADSLESLVEFSYTRRIEITLENVQSLISTTKVLQLIQIHDACWGFLRKTLSLNNVWKIRVIAEKHRCSEMIGLADSYIRQNFEAFSKSKSFLALPFEYLKEVLSADDLVVSTEACVFEGVIRWVKNSPSQEKNNLLGLMSAVRLSQMTPEYLTKMVWSEALLRTSIPCRDLIDEAKRFNWLPISEKPEISNFMTRPRICGGKFQHLTCSDTNTSTIHAVSSPHSSQSENTLDSESEQSMKLSTSNFEVTTQAHQVTPEDKKDSTTVQNISPGKEKLFEDVTGKNMAAVRRHRSKDEINPAALDTITFESEGNKIIRVLRGKVLRFNDKTGCALYTAMNIESGQQVVVIQWSLPYSPKVEKDLSAVRENVEELAKLQHKNLVRYLGMTWEKKEERVLVQILQEYVEGISLPSLCRISPLTTEQLHVLSEEVLLTLQFLHEHSVFHERLRPSSIFFDQTGCVLLSDYSIDQRLYKMSSLHSDQRGHSSGEQHDMNCLDNLLCECLGYQGKALRTLPRSNSSPVAVSAGCLVSDATNTRSAKELVRQCSMPSPSTSPLASEEGHSDITRKEQKKTLPSIAEIVNILEPLGQGSFGKVFKVVHKLDSTIYAAKCIPLNHLDSSPDREAIKEVQTLCKLNHKNVVRYFTSFIGIMPDEEKCKLFQASRETVSSDSEKISKCLCILTEYCDKKTLRTVIDLGSLHRSQNDEISPYLTGMYHSILNGLQYIHQKGIIHRDLKPENIFVDVYGAPKIGDFGLATTVSRPHPFPNVQLQQFFLGSKSSDGSSVSNSDVPDESHSANRGTDIYRAPELQSFAVKSKYSNKVDLYSLGIILFEMSRPPFPSAGERVEKIQVLRDVEIGHESDLAHLILEPKIRTVLYSLLQKNPCHRKGLLFW